MIEFDMTETCDLRMKHNCGIYMQKI